MENNTEVTTGQSMGARAAKLGGSAVALLGLTAAPAMAQAADLGAAASGAATTGVGYAVAAAGIVIVFTGGYKLVKKVVGG